MRNEAHYTRTKPRGDDKSTSFINGRNWWKYLMAVGSYILVGPFIAKRIENLPRTEKDYWQKVGLYGILTSIVGIILIWQLLLRPYLNSRKGYNLRGQFIVIRKANTLGQRILFLQPGVNHKVKVDRQFYKYINVGDKILVERRPMGDILKLKKI